MSDQPLNVPIVGASPDDRAYASWGLRALGFFLDFLPALVLTAIAQIFFVSSIATVDRNWSGGPTYQVIETRGPGLMFYLLYAIAITYWFWNKGYVEGTTGQSIAKRFLGCTTVDGLTKEPLGVAKGLLRALLVYIELILIAFCGLGLILWLWPIWDERKQALFSDKAVNAVVYRLKTP